MVSAKKIVTKKIELREVEVEVESGVEISMSKEQAIALAFVLEKQTSGKPSARLFKVYSALFDLFPSEIQSFNECHFLHQNPSPQSYSIQEK
jgi:hypothetical protein